MSLKQLPKINAKSTDGLSWDTHFDAIAKWDKSVVAVNTDDANITIYDHIGSDGWSEGVTAKRISAALRAIGERAVTVYINSPGGDFFEGVAIYNLLLEHKAKITVKVVGLAASAASVIAMAGDERLVAKSGFLMIHNAWAFVVGNRHDLKDAGAVLGEFDSAMAGVYSDVSGIPLKNIKKMMDDESFFSGQSAIDKGFATGLLASEEIKEGSGENNNATAALRKIDTLMAKNGITRSERRSLIKDITGTPSAADITPSADVIGKITELTKFLRGK